MKKISSDIPVFEYIDASDCCGCEACVSGCPKKAIEMIADSIGFLYPKLDQEKCIRCGACLKKCPMLQKKEGVVEKKSYAGYALDKNTVSKSSSGGFFGVIADNLLKDKNWVIVGVAWSDDYRFVKHICIDKTEDLPLIQRSKYIQSIKGDIYSQVEKKLRQGEKVLFCGCPCEVAGMIQTIDKPLRRNLYTLDLVCQGPTPIRAWDEYKSYTERKFHSKISDVNMRLAIGPWIPQYLHIGFQNNKKFEKLLYETEFGDSVRIMQRPSCYKCKFAGSSSFADITLGDYHGISTTDSCYNESGVSICVVHTQKGNELLHCLNDKCVHLEKADYFKLAKDNPRMEKPWPPRQEWDIFTKKMAEKNLFAASRAITSWKDRIKRKLPNWLRKKLKAFLTAVKHI